MPRFVVDASATMPWCFEDEATSWSESLLDRVDSGDPIVVPAHWHMEVTNTLLMGERKGRIEAGMAEALLDQLDKLPKQVQEPLDSKHSKEALRLSRRYQLTFYDAAYLELALRLRLELATKDNELLAAAIAEGVILL